MTATFTEKLQAEYERIEALTKSGKLPIDERIKEIDVAVSDYALAHAEAYRQAQAKAGANGQSPNIVPINFKDAYMLEQFANLVLHEDLSWSHPDKMAIVDYPIMSDDQRKVRLKTETSEKWAESIGTDRRDHAPKTRDYCRRLRN